MSFLLNLLIIVICLALAGLFACIAVLVWEPGLRQGWKVNTAFAIAVALGTVFALAALVVPALEL